MVPLLETPRLVLRAHRFDDLPRVHALWSSPEVTRYITGTPSTREESWSRLLRLAGHWALRGFGYWLVEEKGTGRFVGQVGFGDWKRELEPSIAGLPEIGWVLAPTAAGRGQATEAALAALAWADAHLAERRTVCLIHPDNQASFRVAEKCGYREVARTIYKAAPTVLLERWGPPLIPPAIE